VATSDDLPHPFRVPPGAGPAEADKVRDRIGEVLQRHEALIWKTVRAIAGPHHQQADLEDMVQEVRMKLVVATLPRYRGEPAPAQVYCFLRTSVRWIVLGLVRSPRFRLTDRPCQLDRADQLFGNPNSDPADRTPDMADAIRKNLESILSPAVAETAASVAEHPGTKGAEAERLTGHSLAKISRARQMLAEWIREQGIDDLTPDDIARFQRRGRTRKPKAQPKPPSAGNIS
jgi:DNA-directed RNA polymerase specialized sigma24 family protein